MSELLIALVVLGAIAVPHLLPLHAASPQAASAVWFLALALRGILGVGSALFVFTYLPRTELFQGAAGWCWAVITHHLGLSGHPLLHAAAILPGLALAASLLWVLFGLVRAGVALHVYLARRAVGEGPMGSLVVEGDDILIAVVGLGRGRIVVSQKALGAMDRDELTASFAHELGHLRRRHRPLLVLGSVFAGLGRLLPGTVSAAREFAFNLERDADEYAVRTTRDPLSLASAICKAAGAARPTAGLTALGGQGRVSLRLDHLTGNGRRAPHALEVAARMLAGVLAVMVMALAVAVPARALAAPSDAAAVARLSPACPWPDPVHRSTRNESRWSVGVAS